MMRQIINYGTYSQIVGEDNFDVLSELDKSLSFKVPGAEFSRAFKGFVDKSGKFQRWDGTRRILTKDLKFGSGLVPRIIDFYKSHGIDISVDDQRPVKSPSSEIDISAILKSLDKEPYDYQSAIIPVIDQNERGIIKSATGSGKCNSIDSINFSSLGMLDYEELAQIAGVTLQAGEAVPFVTDVATPIKQNNRDVVSMLYRDGYGKSLKLITKYRFNLTGTAEHKIKIIDQNGDMVWRKFQELKIGDYAAVSYDSQIFGQADMSVDDAYWYGLLTGDGCLSRSNTVTFTNMDAHLLNFSQHYLKNNNLKATFKKTNSKATDVIICSVAYREKLVKLGFKKSLSIHKDIPTSIRQLKKEPLAMFVRGLYETDGWVDVNAICIALSSPKLIKQLQMILLNFGIVSAVRIKKTSHQDSHVLSIYREFIPKFMNEIGLDPNGYKFNKANKLLKCLGSKKQNNNVNVIPNQNIKLDNINKALRKQLGYYNFHKEVKNAGFNYHTIRSWAGKGAWRLPNPAAMKKYLLWAKNTVDKNNELITIINSMLVACNDLVFLPIKSIEESFTDNWDFVVPDTHSFISQGFVNHNTLIASLITAHLGKKTIVYVIGKDLLYQFYDLFKDIFGDRAGIIGDGQCKIGDFNIASIWTVGQALGIKKGDVLLEADDSEEKLDLGSKSHIMNMMLDAKVHIIDECHMAACNTIQQIYKKTVGAEHIYGLSGSPWRDDNADLLIEAILGRYIVDIPASYLIKRGFLAQPIIKFIEVPALLEKPPNNYATIYKQHIVENDVRNNLILKAAKQLTSQGYQTLILFNSLAHGKILHRLISSEIPCAILDGSNSQETRNEVKQKLLNGELHCVLASKIFDIGVDIPSLSGLIVACAGKSTVKAIQRVGRVIRKYPGKKYAAIIDFADNCKFLDKHSKIRFKVYKSEDGFDVSWIKKKK